MYNALILIDPETQTTLAGLKNKIRQVFTGSLIKRVTVEIADDELRLSWPNFTFRVRYVDGAHVLAESGEIAEKFAKKHSARDRIGQCRARFEVSSDEDPSMSHFNEFIFIIESAERLGRVYAFDPDAGEFM